MAEKVALQEKAVQVAVNQNSIEKYTTEALENQPKQLINQESQTSLSASESTVQVAVIQNSIGLMTIKA